MMWHHVSSIVPACRPASWQAGQPGRPAARPEGGSQNPAPELSFRAKPPTLPGRKPRNLRRHTPQFRAQPQCLWQSLNVAGANSHDRMTSRRTCSSVQSTATVPLAEPQCRRHECARPSDVSEDVLLGHRATLRSLPGRPDCPRADPSRRNSRECCDRNSSRSCASGGSQTASLSLSGGGMLLTEMLLL